MTDKLMYIPNYDTQNYPFCRLQLVGEIFSLLHNEPIQEMSLKLLKQRIRKPYNKTLGTCVINIPMSPPSLDKKKRKGEKDDTLCG